MQPPYYEGWTQGPSPASAAPHQTGAGNGMQPLGLRAGGAEAYEASCPAVRPEPPPAPPPGPRKDEEAFARYVVCLFVWALLDDRMALASMTVWRWACGPVTGCMFFRKKSGGALSASSTAVQIESRARILR